MNARALVGMTQSAKKRRAWSLLLTGCMCRLCRKYVEDGQRGAGYPLLTESGQTELRWRREALRVGARVRPCPGCPACGRPWFAGINLCCDGAGVVPAKNDKANARRISCN